MPFESELQRGEKGQGESTQSADRKLGDEWEGWDGTSEGEIDEPKGRFILLTSLVWVLLALLLAFGGYLIEPRLNQWPPVLRWLTKAFFVCLLGGGLVLYGLILLEVLTEKVTILPYRCSEGMLLWLLPKAVWIGGKLGFSRDRVANSFIKVSNIVTRSHRRRLQCQKLLILLPRCLSKSSRQEIRQLVEGQPYGLATVAGGEEARKVIRQQHPNFIIALACERDLVSGIRDVALHIPVIGIPNKRPEGPCKNTYVDMEEFREALRLFEDHQTQWTPAGTMDQGEG
jgi:uncharacterized protein